MNAEELEDVRQRILDGETIPAEEMRQVIDHLRNDRKSADQARQSSKSKGKSGSGAKKRPQTDAEVEALFNE